MDPIISQTLQKDQQLQAGNNLIGAGGLSPAAGATALQAGPKVGISPDVAVYNPDPVKAQADLADAQARVAASPHLTSFMAQAGPATVAAAQPHLEGLAAIGQKVQNFIDNTDSGVHEFLKGVPFGSDIENVGKAPVQAFKSADALVAQAHEAYSKGNYLQGLSLEGQSVLQNFAGLAGYTPVGAAYNLAARPVAEGLATATEAGVGAFGGKTTPAQHAKDTADFEKSIGLGILAIKPGGAEPAAPGGKTGTGVVPAEPAPTGGGPAPAPNIENPVTPSDFAARDAAREVEANRVYRSLPVRDGDNFAVNYQGYVTHAGGQPAVFANEAVAQAWVDKVGNPNPTSSQQFTVLSDGDGPATVMQTNLPKENLSRPAGENPAVDAVQGTLAKLDEHHMNDLQNTLGSMPKILENPELLTAFLEHIGTKTIDFSGSDVASLLWNNHDALMHSYDVLSQEQSLALSNAANDGGIWQVPLTEYLKLTAGKPWAQALNQLAVFRPGGISAQQAEDKKENTKASLGTQAYTPTAQSKEDFEDFEPIDFGAWEPERDPDMSPAGAAAVKQVAPQVAQAVKEAADSALAGAHLSTVFDAPNALGMNKPQFLAYSQAIKAAQQKTYEQTLKKVAAEIKKYGDKAFKGAYDNHFQTVFDEALNNQPVAAMFTMLYSEGAPTGYLPGPDGKPETFYRATHHPNVEPGEWFIPSASPYKGLSFAANPKFGDRWGQGNYHNYLNPQDTQSPGYDAEGNLTSGTKTHQAGIVHIVHFQTNSYADFRRPEDVKKANDWIQKNKSWLGDKTYELSQGNWGLWEQPKMMDDLGWDVVRMMENSSQKGEPNAFTHKMELIHFKWVDAKTGEVVKLAPEVQKLFKQYKLPNALFAPGGMSADEAATKFGYANSAQMLEEIAQLHQVFGRKDPKKFLVQAAKEQAQALAEQDVGIKLSKEDIQQMAREQTAAPHAQDILLDELSLLYSMAPGTSNAHPFSKEDIKNFANVTFERMVVNQAINTRALHNQVNKFATKAERAVIAGKFAEAIQAKQNQIVNLVRVDDSFKFAKLQRRTDKIWQGWAGHKTIDGVDQKFLNYVHLVLKETGHSVNRDTEELLANIGGIPLAQFIKMANSTGFVSVTEAQVPPGEPKSWTVEQWRAVAKMLASLMKAGRAIQEVNTAKEQYKLQTFGAVVLGNANRQNPAFSPERLRRMALAQFNFAESAGHEVASVARSYLMAQHATLSTIYKIMDYSKNGPMFNACTVPLEKSGYDYAVFQKRNVEYLKEVAKVASPEYMKTLREDITTPPGMWVDGKPFLQQRAELLGVMFNMGTSDNMTKVCEGYNWDPAVVMAWVEQTASEEDKKYTQAVWDTLKKYWPEISAQGMRIQGVAPTQVRSQSFIKGLRGGYYPLWTANPAHMPTDPIFGDGFSPALPTHGWIEERKNAKYQVSLNPNLFVHRLDQIAYDLAFRETLMQVLKIHSLKEVNQAIDSLVGPEMAKQVTQAIQYISHRDVAANTQQDSLVNALNRIKSANVLAAVLFNIRLVMLHAPVAALHSVGVGGPQFFTAIKDILQAGLPIQKNKWIQMVHQNSPDVLLGWETNDRDIHNAFEELKGKTADIEKWYIKFGTLMLRVTSQLSSYPLWLAVYRKSLAENLLDEKRAINLANEAIRVTHGSSTSVDLAAYLRKTNTPVGALAQTFLVFRGFASSIRQQGILANRALMRVAGGGYGKGPPAPPMPPAPDETDGLGPEDFGDPQTPPTAKNDLAIWLYAFIFYGVSTTVVYGVREKTFHPDEPWWECFALGAIEGYIGPYAGGGQALELAHEMKYVQIHDLKKEWEKHWLDMAVTAANDLSAAFLHVKASIPKAVTNPINFTMHHQSPSDQRALARHPGDAARGLITGSTGRKP